MATHTVGGSAFEFVADVAGGAFERGMYASECESGVLQVIEVDSEPTVEVVALIASSRKPCAAVDRARGRLEIYRMAGIALRRKPLKLAYGRAFVTGIAIQGSMCSEQREAIHVILDLLQRDLPSPHGVALLTARSKLALMNVRMTVGTSLSDIGEHGFGMAFRTSYSLVHAA